MNRRRKFREKQDLRPFKPVAEIGVSTEVLCSNVFLLSKPEDATHTQNTNSSNIIGQLETKRF
jgi:hypothetical protein